MKKLSFLLLIGIILALVSCNKQTAKPNAKPLQRNAATTSLRMQITSHSTSEQRVLFASLSAEQKYQVWIDKTEQVIEVGNWNQDQLAYLNSLLTTLNEDMFSEELHQNYDNTMSSMQNTGNTIFTYNQLFLIIGTLVDYPSSGDINETYAQNAPKGGSSTEPDIECSCCSYDPWCGRGAACAAKCEFSTTWGCGGWLRHDCDGACGN